MTEEQVKRVVDELMDRMFGRYEMEEREVQRMMQEEQQQQENENARD